MSKRTISATYYLVLKYKGEWKPPGLRLAVKSPALHRDEIVIKCSIELPVSLFTKPQLEAKLKVDGDVAPMVIDVEMINNIEESVKKATGLDIVMKVVEADK